MARTAGRKLRCRGSHRPSLRSQCRAAGAEARQRNTAVVEAAKGGTLRETLLKWADERVELNAVNVATALHRGAKLRPPLEPAALRYLATELQRAAAGEGGPQTVANALYGLRDVPDGAEVRQLIAAVTPHAAAAASASAERVSPQHVGNALYGLAGRSGDSAEARALVAALIPFARAAGRLSQQALGMSLYGLQQHVDHPEARAMVAALSDFVEDVPPLTSAAVSEALLGLGMHEGTPETERLLELLAAKVEGCPEQLSATEISSSLLGLRAQRRCAAVHDVLAALTKHAEKCSEAFSPEQAGQALYGLQRQSDSTEKQHFMLKALVPLVLHSRGTWRAQSIGMALYGMGNMADNAQPRQIIAALSKQMPLSSGWDAASVALSLYGLRSKSDNVEVREAVAVLIPIVKNAAGLQLGPAEAFQAVYGMHSIGETAETAEMLLALAALIPPAEDPDDSAQLVPALYGLHGHDDSPATRAVVAALLPHIEKSAPLEQRTLSAALFGLRGLGASPEARRALRLLGGRLRAAGQLSPVAASSVAQALLAMRDAGADTGDLLQYVLRSAPVDTGQDAAAVQGLMQMHTLAGTEAPPELAAATERMPPGDAKNMAESAVRWLLERAGLQGFQFNTTHPTGFEFDLLWRGRVNVELDGYTVAYRAPGKQRIHQMRRMVLEDRFGIKVLRLDCTKLSLSEVISQIAKACGAEAAAGEQATAWTRALALAERGWFWVNYETGWATNRHRRTDPG